MRVRVLDSVLQELMAFYDTAISLHPTLDESTIQEKMNRCMDAVQTLGDFPEKYPLARHKKNWVEHHYRDFVYEDIHFAYKVVLLDTGEKVVYVIDACHSLLYHD